MINIKNRDIDAIINAMSALDGSPEIVKVTGNDGSERSMVHVNPYKLPAKVRLLAARWIAAIRQQSETVKKAQEGLFRQYQDPAVDGKPPTIPSERIHLYANDLDDLRAQHESHNIPGLPLEGLGIEANQIPISVITALIPVIADDLTK